MNQSYPKGAYPDLPPPEKTSGVIKWVKNNLLSSPLNIFLTAISLWIIWSIVPPILKWVFFESIWIANSRAECWDQMSYPREGACWAFIKGSFNLFVYGWYPEEERWRVNLSFVLLILAIFGVLKEGLPGKKYWLMYSVIFPFIAAWLLIGGFGLTSVETKKLGGILLTVVIGVTGITFSLPIGILLALGRKSELLIVRAVCITFIEFIRGVPLITLLFMASTMLSYFLPPGTTFDLLVRVLIVVTLFSSAYIAEVIRGGLQGLSKGQYEAADSLGLGYWKAHRLIILPQALKISIPGIVNTFIGLYKDTTLVLIIGMMDIVGLGRARLGDAKWQGLAGEVYLFIAIFFFICCFSMSRYSINLENKLSTGRRD